MKTCPNENCSRKLEKIIKQRMNIYDENNSSQNDQTNYSHQYALTQPSNDGPKYNHIFHTVSEFDSKTHNNHKYKKKRNLSINDCPGGNSCKNYKQITELQSQVQKLSKTVEELTKVNEYFKFMLLQKERMYQILLAKTSSSSKSKEPPTTPRIPKKVRQSLTKEETACMYGSNNTNNMNINSKHKVNPYEKLMEISTRNQKHNLQNSSGVSFLALSDERLRELISNPSLNHLYQLTLSDEIFINEFKTADNDALISYCDVISSVTKDYQNTLNLIRSIKHFMLGSVELVNSVFLNNTTSVLISNTNRVLDCENTSIYIHDSFTDMLIEHTSATAGSAPSKAMNTKDSNNIVSTVFNTGERIKIDDIATDTRFTKRSSHHSKLKNILCYPLRDNDGDIFGVIEATNKRKGCFDNNDEEILSCYSKQASGILQHIMNIESSLTQINKLKNIITYQIEISNPQYRVIDFVKRTEQLVERVFMSSSSQVLLDVNGKLYDPKKKAYVSELGLVHYVYRKKECHGCSDVKHCQYYNMLTDIYSVDSLVTYPVIEPDNDRVVGIIQTIFNAKLSDKYNLPKHNEMMLFNLIGNCFVSWVSNNSNLINNIFNNYN